MSTSLNTINSTSLSGTQDNNAQILNDIQSLQDIEQQLFNSLDENPNLTPSQQEQIIKKINDISNMRINLYQTLSSVNNYFSTTLSNSRGTLSEQTAAIGIVENELIKSKNKLRVLKEEKYCLGFNSCSYFSYIKQKRFPSKYFLLYFNIYYYCNWYHLLF